MKTNFLLCLLLIVSAPLIAIGQENGRTGGIENLRQTSNAFATIAREVSPAVVYIQADKVASTPAWGRLPFDEDWPFGDDFLERFFGRSLPQPSVPRSESQPKQFVPSQGSGFIFSTDQGLFSKSTYVLTNNHVVEGAENIKVRLLDGKEFAAKVKGADPRSDVAVLEIDAGGLPVLGMGDSSILEVGEWVLAIGNPFGLQHTLTVGVVSAKGRTSLGINDYEDFIQTDAAINPGNSGGPLVNLEGRVVGMNTAILSRSGGYMGIGFAIPINLAQSIAKQLIDNGEVARGYLGVVIQELTADLAESFGLEDTKGIVIAQVTKDSPADKAGLKVGDVIIRYQDKAITNLGAFRNQVALTPPGSRENLEVLRDGKAKSFSVKLGKLSPDAIGGIEDPSQSAVQLGLTVQTLTPELAQQFAVKGNRGVVVTKVEPGSIAALAGIETGEVILEVNRQAIGNSEEFRAAIEMSEHQRRVLLLAQRGETARYVVLKW